MLTRILTVLLVAVIMGLLISQRIFALPPEVVVVISRVEGETDYAIGQELSRGEMIETADAFLKMEIGPATTLWLATDTQIELHRLYEDELVIRLTKGRLIVDTKADVPVAIETNHTFHRVHQDSATFVNYDFLETIHVIPLTGAVQTYIETTGEHVLTPAPISIHETSPVTYAPLEANLQAGNSAEFYLWTGVLTEI